MEGTLYLQTKNLNFKEIAKLIRTDLKNTFGKDIKFSVQTEYYSGGRSLNVKIKETIRNYLNPLNIKFPNERHLIYTDEGNELIEQIENIINKYNYDNSDSMTDYFDVRFYSHVWFDCDLKEKWEKEYELN